MENITQWIPTIAMAATVIGVAFIADASIKRHEAALNTLTAKVQALETKVAVLEDRGKG